MTRNKRALIKLSGVHGSTPSCGHSACLFLSAQIKNSSFYPEGWTKSKLFPVSGAQSGGEPVENQRKPTDNSSSWWKVSTLLSFHFSPTNETGNVLMRMLNWKGGGGQGLRYLDNWIHNSCGCECIQLIKESVCMHGAREGGEWDGCEHRKTGSDWGRLAACVSVNERDTECEKQLLKAYICVQSLEGQREEAERWTMRLEVCVCEKQLNGEKDRNKEVTKICVCVCVCVREREWTVYI